MRLLDTNVMVYAILDPHSSNHPESGGLISPSMEIMARIEKGEPAVLSTVHLSEFINIISRRMGISMACHALKSLFTLDNLIFYPVEKEDYELAVEISQDQKVGINDCLAVVIMGRLKIKEIYSFDQDFDKLGITRITH